MNCPERERTFCRFALTSTTWAKQPPRSIHAYRVECAQCKRFLSWGTEKQLNARQLQGQDVRIIEYKPPMINGLEQFYEDEPVTTDVEQASDSDIEGRH